MSTHTKLSWAMSSNIAPSLDNFVTIKIGDIILLSNSHDGVRSSLDALTRFIINFNPCGLNRCSCGNIITQTGVCIDCSW